MNTMYIYHDVGQTRLCLWGSGIHFSFPWEWQTQAFCSSILDLLMTTFVFPGGSMVMNPPAKQEMRVQSLGGEKPWRRKWQPTPIFLPGKSHAQRSLVGYGPWGCKEFYTTEQRNNNSMTPLSHRSVILVLKNAVISKLSPGLTFWPCCPLADRVQVLLMIDSWLLLSALVGPCHLHSCPGSQVWNNFSCH